MITDGLDEPLDFFLRKLAIFSKDQSSLPIKGGTSLLSWVILSDIYQDFLIVPHINGFRIAFLFIFETGKRNSENWATRWPPC